jgi:16S rRNA (guanine966-N2)-methyltransferase
MRVIAGRAKGVRLGPVPPGTRPVSDRAREGLFASLGSLVDEATCLDLYAGTGAVGIEALSRGAATCTFVDRSRAAAAAIRDNLTRAKLTDLGAVRCLDVGAYLGKRPPAEPRFDLVFLDPPYDTDASTIERTLTALDDGWLDPAWTVVVTRGHKGPEPAVPLHWAVRRRLHYGDSLLFLYREVGWA